VANLRLPAASLPVVYEALRVQLLSVTDDLRARITSGGPDIDDELDRFDEVRSVLREAERGEVSPSPMFVEALRRQLETEQHLADTHNQRQRRRAEANVAMIERLLDATGLTDR
jgi:hypothetical protein